MAQWQCCLSRARCSHCRHSGPLHGREPALREQCVETRPQISCLRILPDGVERQLYLLKHWGGDLRKQIMRHQHIGAVAVDHEFEVLETRVKRQINVTTQRVCSAKIVSMSVIFSLTDLRTIQGAGREYREMRQGRAQGLEVVGDNGEFEGVDTMQGEFRHGRDVGLY